MDRYSIGNDPEDLFEPGSGNLVLLNKLGIIDPVEIGIVESQLLNDAISNSLEHLSADTVISFNLVQEFHTSWLSKLYSFAGQLRDVNVSKGGILFAPIEHLSQSLGVLDKTLRANTPCLDFSRKELVSAIARVHSEFILVHPFREGNGRTARWICDVMALQAGNKLLNWQFDEDPKGRRELYFAALATSFAGDLTALEMMIDKALSGS